MIDPAREAVEEAFAHDRAGREAEAIPCYEQALELGLPDALRQQALLGLGSSLRNVRRHADAVRVLEAAVAEYPDHGGLRFFLALARWSAGGRRWRSAARARDWARLASLDGRPARGDASAQQRSTA